MSQADCRIVLVRPRDPNNIGAVARAMKNFGFADLWIVGIHPPTWAEVTSAVNATDVLIGARVVATLAEAVADCNLVVGTGDHTRVAAKQVSYTPRELSRDLQTARSRLALVFGSEKTGLTNDDLSHCHRVLSIPTLPDCPSMNLGQAVAVCCYELTREQPSPPPDLPATTTANAITIEVALKLLREVLHQIDFVLPGNEGALMTRLRATLMRFALTKYDAEMLCGILDRIKKGLTR